MSNERPFEVGDLVVSKRNGIGIVSGVDATLSVDYGRPIHCFYFYCDLSDIKTIRKPRKGSKEARDIVAMLKWEYKNARYVAGDTDISGVLAEKAKLMLK